MGKICLKSSDNSYGNISHFNDKIHFLQVWAENFQCFGTDIDGNLYAWGLNDVKEKFTLVLPTGKWNKGELHQRVE